MPLKIIVITIFLTSVFAVGVAFGDAKRKLGEAEQATERAIAELRRNVLAEKFAENCRPQLRERVIVEWVRGELICKHYSKRLNQMSEIDRRVAGTWKEFQE